MHRPELVEDARYATNAARVANRAEIVKIVTDVLMQHERDYWLKEFAGKGSVYVPYFASVYAR